MKSLNDSKLMSAKSSVVHVDQTCRNEMPSQLSQKDMSRQLKDKLGHLESRKFNTLQRFEVQEEQFTPKNRNPFSPQKTAENDESLLFERADDTN